MPQRKTIAGEWLKHRRLDLPEELRDLSAEDLARTCWGCGSAARWLTRAHIKPRKDGGTLHPLNLWLLCRLCHGSQPEHEGEERNWAWFRARWRLSRHI